MLIARQRGAALITALMALLLLSTLGLALILFTTTELAVAGAFRDGHEAMYAAEAILERALDDLQSVSDWNVVLTGQARSAFVDGSPSGTRTVEGSTIDLAQETTFLNTEDRPWAANDPAWQLYAYGRLDQLAPATDVNSAMYVMAWVGDDASENDGDPTADGDRPSNPGSGILAVRAVAFGPSGMRRSLEALIKRGAAGVSMLSWRELR